jgi:hypothetical protein
MRKLSLVVAVFVLVLAAAGQANANIVYIGADPSSSAHDPGQAQAHVLVGNAARFAGGGADPRILVVGDGDPGFGSHTAAILAGDGFTHVTSIASSALAGIDLSNFDEIYVAPTTRQTDVDNYIASAAKILAYTDAGGGLVVEPEVFATGSWSWVPDAALIGNSGSNNVGLESVHIVDPSSPVMAGLTDAGLSNWGISVHSTFATPGAGGFTDLTVSGTLGHIIAKEIAPVPEPGSLTLLGIGAVSLFGYGWRRRKTVVA